MNCRLFAEDNNKAPPVQNTANFDDVTSATARGADAAQHRATAERDVYKCALNSLGLQVFKVKVYTNIEKAHRDHTRPDRDSVNVQTHERGYLDQRWVRKSNTYTRG